MCLDIHLIRRKQALITFLLPLGRMTHLYGSLCKAKATNYTKAPVQAFAFQFPFSIRKLYLETSVFPAWKTKISIKEPQHGSVVWCNPLYNSKHSNSTGLF